MPRITISVSQPMHDELALYAEAWQQSLAGLVRLAVQDLLQRPEDYREVLTEMRSPLVDTRTPAQREQAERYMEQMQAFDLGAVVADPRQREALP